MGRLGTGAIAIGLSLATAAPGMAQPGLDSLIPLVEIYATVNDPTPGFDVAGIRCAALFTAQKDWADRHREVRGPTRDQIADVELNLTRAEIFRQEQGLGLTGAYQSTLEDVQRLIALYQARFAQVSTTADHPWRNDGLIRSDTSYCEALAGRN